MRAEVIIMSRDLEDRAALHFTWNVGDDVGA